jgi:hypothetical protein
MPKIPAEDARELARLYYDLAVTLGQFRFDNWNSFSSAQRAELESLEWTLLTQSSDMTTRAISLATKPMKPALKDISRATRNLTRAVRRITDVRKTINIATKAIDMGSAVFTGNIEAITKAVGAAISAAGLDEK